MKMQKSEIRVMMKYEFIRGSSAWETAHTINDACDNRIFVSMSTIRRWFNKFDTGDFDLSKLPLDVPEMLNKNFDNLRDRFKSNKCRELYTHYDTPNGPKYLKPATNVNFNKNVNGGSGKGPNPGPTPAQMDAMKMINVQQAGTLYNNKMEAGVPNAEEGAMAAFVEIMNLVIEIKKQQVIEPDNGVVIVGVSNSPGNQTEMRVVLAPHAVAAMRKLAFEQYNQQVGSDSRPEVRAAFVPKPMVPTNKIEKEVNKRNNN